MVIGSTRTGTTWGCVWGHEKIEGMQRKRDGLVPIGDAVSGPDDVLAPAIRDASPQARHSSARKDQHYERRNRHPIQSRRSGPVEVGWAGDDSGGS